MSQQSIQWRQTSIPERKSPLLTRGGPGRYPRPTGKAISAAVGVFVLLGSAGCSGDSGGAAVATPTSSASVKVVGGSPKVSLPPAAPRVASPRPVTLDGVSYAAAGAGARSRAAATARQNRQVVNATTVRSIEVGGRPFGDLMIFSVADRYLGSSLFKRQFATTVVASTAGDGSAPAFKEFSGRTFVTSVGKTNVVAAYAGKTVVAVSSTEDLDSVIELVSRYVKAKGGSSGGSGAGSRTPSAEVTDPVG